jgi:hypothetical protein
VKPRFGRRWRGSEAGRHEGGKYLAGTSRKGKPTSGLEPLTCSLGVRLRTSAGIHRGSKIRISKRISLWAYAGEHSRICLRWCTNGVLAARLAGFEPATGGLVVCADGFVDVCLSTESRLDKQFPCQVRFGELT